MKIKNLIGILAVFAILAIIPFVSADEASDLAQLEISVDADIDASTDVDAGTTPDSPLYGIENAMENIGMALTFNKERKAEKGLIHAQEKLAEIKKMIEEGKLEQAEKARARYNKAVENANNAVLELESDGDADKSREALEKIIRLQNKAEDHFDKLSAVKTRILEKHGDNLTEEQRAKLDAFFEKIENKSAEVETRLEAKKEKIEIKYKALSGKSDEEVQAEESAIEQTTGIEKERKTRANKEILRTKLVLLKAKEKIRDKLNDDSLDAQTKSELLAELEATGLDLEDLNETDFNETNFKRLREAVKDLRENGNEISEIARTLREAHRNGTFNETKAELRLKLEERRELRKNALEERKELRKELREKTENGEVRTEIRSRMEEKDGRIKERIETRQKIRSDSEDSDDEVESETESDDSNEIESEDDSNEVESEDDSDEVESEDESDDDDNSNFQTNITVVV